MEGSHVVFSLFFRSSQSGGLLAKLPTTLFDATPDLLSAALDLEIGIRGGRLRDLAGERRNLTNRLVDLQGHGTAHLPAALELDLPREDARHFPSSEIAR